MGNSISRRGQAMVISILALTVLTAIAIALSVAARLELRTATRGVEAVRRHAVLRGEVNRGIGILERGRRSPRELFAALRQYGELRWVPVPGSGDPDHRFEVALQLQDASARLNLAHADADSLQKLPGVDKQTAQAIASWQDRRSRDDFSRFPAPYEPSRRPFDSIEELLLIKGADPVTLFGSADETTMRAARFPPVSEMVAPFSGENNTDASGHARADVNSASVGELVEAADGLVTELQAQNLERIRQGRQLTQTGQGNLGEPGQAAPTSDRRVFTSAGDALQQAGIRQEHWGPMLDAWTVDRRSFLAGRVNVNTASPAVLRAVPGVSQSLADAILQARREHPEGLQWSDLLTAANTNGVSTVVDLDFNVDGLVAGASFQLAASGQPSTELLERVFCVRSSVYLVRVLVREVGSGRIEAAQATVYWPASPSDAAQIVQWREPDRLPGWSAWYRPVSGEEGGKREP